MTIIKHALAAHAASRRRTFHNRNQTVGASEIGRCERQIWCRKHGIEVAHPEDDLGATTRGNLIESFWVDALRERFGERLLFAGDEQRTFRVDYLSATPDALIVDVTGEEAAALGMPELEGGCTVAECKSIDPRIHLTEPKPEHTLQVQAQLGLLRETTNYTPTHALISYICASSMAVTEFIVGFDPAVYAAAKQRARKIMEARDIAKTMPEGYVAGGQECERCSFAGSSQWPALCAVDLELLEPIVSPAAEADARYDRRAIAEAAFMGPTRSENDGAQP